MQDEWIDKIGRTASGSALQDLSYELFNLFDLSCDNILIIIG
jgi:hypothetical protein